MYTNFDKLTSNIKKCIFHEDFCKSFKLDFIKIDCDVIISYKKESL